MGRFLHLHNAAAVAEKSGREVVHRIEREGEEETKEEGAVDVDLIAGTAVVIVVAVE